MIKIVNPDPSTTIIEKTAGEFAGVFYDAARSSGLKTIMLQGDKINLMKYKTPREFARRHLQKFIPAAVEALTTIMANDKTPEAQRQIIYQALQERINDEGVNTLGAMAGLPEFQNTPLYNPDNEKPKPIIINSPKLDFDFNSKRLPNG